MSDIKLFQLGGTSLTELASSSSPLEKSLQSLFEKNLETLLGVRFLASEYTTDEGRMDTLGIDENGAPVVIEYKRDRSESVINQGLFYLNWLMDHRGDFEILVRDGLGKEVADQIEWGAPRLICIAADFTKYDTQAVKQMGRNIELIRYRQFGDGLLLLDLLTSVSVPSTPGEKTHKYRTVSDGLSSATPELRVLYEELEEFLISLGDDVTQKTLQNYFAFRRIKNFACVEVRPQVGVVRAYLKLNPADLELEDGFTRDVRGTGHYGTGDLEVNIKTPEDLERAKPLIIQSYEAS